MQKATLALVLSMAWLLAIATTSSSSIQQHFTYYNEGELPGLPKLARLSQCYGVFFSPTLDFIPFTIERMRFYHAEDNSEPDEYRVHIIIRHTPSDSYYVVDSLDGFTTSGTNCWEEAVIEETYWDSSSEEGWTWGVFMQPRSGGGAATEPKICVDYSVSTPRVNCMMYIDCLGNGGCNLDDQVYQEDCCTGDYFMEVVLRYDVTTATQQTTISAIKSLY